MSRKLLLDLSICKYSYKDHCFVAEGAIFARHLQAAKNDTESYKIFTDLLQELFTAYAERNHRPVELKRKAS